MRSGNRLAYLITPLTNYGNNWILHFGEKEDVVRLKVKPVENTHTKRLQYFIDQAESSIGRTAVAWEKVKIEFPFAVKR